MKLRLLCSAALVAMAAAPAFAQTYYTPAYTTDAPVVTYPVERIYVPGTRDHGALHGGWVAPGDDVLLSDALSALSAEPGMDNMTVTVVAKNGELIVNGVAKDQAQAARIERIARRVANGHVTAYFATQVG